MGVRAGVGGDMTYHFLEIANFVVKKKKENHATMVKGL